MHKLLKKLVFLASVCLFPQVVLADCATNLMPIFTAAQATKACKSFGSAVDHSLVPSADDTYDLGSSTYQWKDLFVDGIAYVDTLYLADGTAAAPSGTFEGDTDLGFYRSAANTLGLSTGGTARLLFDSSGIYPASAGGVSAGTSSLPFGQLYAGNGTIAAYLSYSAGESRGLVGTTSNHNFGFRTNGTTRMYVTTGGHLEWTTADKGLILVSPDGSCSLCKVDNSDVFSCASSAC